MKSKSEFLDIINECFIKSNIVSPKSLGTLNMSLEDVDICIDCVSNILCEEGLESNDEPNEFGLLLEQTIDFLLNIRYGLMDEEGNKL